MMQHAIWRDYEAAALGYRATLEIDPNFVAAHYSLGVLQYEARTTQ